MSHPFYREERLRLFLICLFGIVALWVLHPSIGITDSDAYSYIIGAQSLRKGQGYHDLLGNALNHFPPGYSLLLSLAPNPIITAQVLNYACFGGVLVFIYLLARRSGWNAAAGLAITTALGSSFLRDLAVYTKPDILTYFIFLVATWLFLRTKGWGRLVAYSLWSSLIPIKLVAVVFAPGVLLAEWYLNGSVRLSQRWRAYVATVCCWGLFMAGTILFNYYTIGNWNSPSHAHPTLMSLVNELKRFGLEFFRVWLANWYGSIRAPRILIPFIATVLVGLVSLFTLKPSEAGRPIRWIGLAVLTFSWALQGVRQFYATPRLMGYGMVLVMLSFVPGARTIVLWRMYALAAAGLAVYNATTTSSLGINHPEYRQAAQRVAELSLLPMPIVSNSYHIIDVHAGIPSQPIESLEKLPSDTLYLEITVPNYDAIQKTVVPLKPNERWSKIASVKGANAYVAVQFERR